MTKDELLATQCIIDNLLDQIEMTPDERDYLNILGTLVYEYEQQHDPMPEIYGVELLKVLLAEANLEPNDLLPIFKSEVAVSAVLAGQQEFTVVDIQKLAAFFHVSPVVFLSH